MEKWYPTPAKEKLTAAINYKGDTQDTKHYCNFDY